MNPVEKLTVEVGLDSSKHDKGADKVLSKNKELEKSAVKVEKSTQNMAIGFTKVARAFTGFIATIAISSGLVRLARDTAKANDELLFLEKNLNLSARSIKNWQGVASAMGGSAQGMTNSLLGLKQAMNGLVMFGDDSMLPYFNALGVNVVDSAGKLRKLDDVFMDIAESLEKMPKDQAYTLAKQMGFDEGTINTLLMGKRELQEMLAIQDKLYKSDKKALEASREFNKQQAIVNAQWQALKTMIADALIPTLTRLMKWAGEFFEFLSRNQKIIKEVFLAASIIIGMMLIPMLKAGLIALTAFIAPFAPFLLVVGALGAAFLALYDDYKVWAEGGKSLFDWTAFTNGVNGAKDAIYQLRDSFLALTKPMYELFEKSFPSATDKIGQWTTSVMAAFGHQPSIDALETNANAKANNNVYNPKDKNPVALNGGGGSQNGKRLKASDLKIKSKESIANGASEQGVLQIGKFMQDNLPVHWFAALNDTSHKNRKSQHNKSLAIDMSIMDENKQRMDDKKAKGYAPTYKRKIEKELEMSGLSSKDFKVIDEYNRPSAKSSGGHIHVQFNSVEAAKKYENYKLGAPSNKPATKSSLSKKDTRTMLYKAAKANGLSDKQAAGLIAEIGRENDFDPNLIFGHHKDPKNGAENMGAISWQGDRAVRLRKFLTAKGFFKNGKMVQSQAALNAQMEFLIQEMKDHYPKAKKGFLDNPNVSEQQSAESVGRDYVQWAYNNKKYANGHTRRAEYYRQIENEIRMSIISENAAKAQQSIAYGGAPSFGGNGMINSNNKTVDVQVAAININTSASTISGNMEEAVKGMQQSYFMLEGSSIA